MNYSNPNPNREINIGETSINVLKTVLLLERPYAINYLVRIPQGNSQFGWRKEAHTTLETFGSMDHRSFSETEMIIRWLLMNNYIRIQSPMYGTIEITDRGHEFLSAPKSIFIRQGELKRPWYEWELLGSLRQIRKDAASQMECEPFEVFTNHFLNQLVEIMPNTLADFKQIFGASDIPQTIQQAILAEIQTVSARKEKAMKSKICERAYSFAHQEVKRLFQEGKDL